MVENKLDVLEALRKLSSPDQDRWFSVEDLIEVTQLSEKWVRENLARLELLGLVYVRDGSRGTRFYSLRSTGGSSRLIQTDVSNREQTLLSKTVGSERVRQAVEIGATVQRTHEWPRFPPLPLIKELVERRDEIRQILKETTLGELDEVFTDLRTRREAEREERKGIGNPFAAVTITAWHGLVDGKAKKSSLRRGIIIGTAASAQSRLLAFRFGSYSIPVKFGLTTACGIIHRIEDGKTEPHEILRPERLTEPTGVSEDSDRAEFPGLNKILKQSFHYQLDHEALNFALPLLRDRIHYKTDVESMEHGQGLRSAGSLLLLLKSGSLTPQEQSPFDLLDSEKALYVQRAFDSYLRLRDRLRDHGDSCLAFGVLRSSEPRRSIFREIVSELLRRRWGSKWNPGGLNLLDDNIILGILLNEGEYTAVIKKTPHQDVIPEKDRDRVRGIIGSAKFSQWLENTRDSKTYQFFMGLGNGKALRFDSPVFSEERNEGPEIRDRTADTIFSISSPIEDFEGSVPRIVSYAEGHSEDYLRHMAKIMPTWLGGRTR